MVCLIIVTCLALAFGLPIIPEIRLRYQDREVRTELFERREDENEWKESEENE